MFNWIVSFVTYDVLAGTSILVTNLHWQCIKDGSGFTSRQTGVQSVVGPLAPQYGDIGTAEVVPQVDWVTILHTEMGAPAVTQVESEVDAVLQEKINPTIGGFKPAS